MWSIITIILSIFILVIGLIFLLAPKGILKQWKKEEPEHPGDAEMIQKIRKHGIVDVLIASVWLTMELSGFMYDNVLIYNLSISIAMIIFGIAWMIMPLYAPTDDPEEKEKRLAAAKKNGRLFIIIGLVFILMDFLLFT